jgi:hypothetical protein
MLWLDARLSDHDHGRKGCGMKDVVIGKLQPTLMRGSSRVFLAGDYLGTLYTESATTTAFPAAQEAASLLATERQQGQRSMGIGGLTTANPHILERTY